MATSRTSIIRGPGAIIIGASELVIHDADGITADIQTPEQDIPSSMVGSLDTIKTDQTAQIQATPCGALSQELLEHLYPHQSPVIGASLMGAADKVLAVQSRAGQRVAFSCAALANPPELRLSPILTSFGQATWFACLGLGKAPEDAQALYNISAAQYNLGDPDRTGLTGHHYSGAWGALAIPDTAEGWTVSVELNWEPVTVDSVGTIDWTLAGAVVRASCTPVGLSEAQIMAARAAVKPRGSSMATASDLVISSATGLKVTLKRAALVSGPLRWGTTTLRAGELGFSAHISGGELYKVEMAA